MATIYVDKDATGANDGTSWTDAWTTIDAAMNDITAKGAGPHTVLVKGGKSYLETPVIDTAAANASQYIHFKGDDGAGNAAIVTIDAESTRSRCLDDSLTVGTDVFYCFENFIFKNSTSSGVDTDVEFLVFKNCEFNNNGGYGIRARGFVMFERCSATGNTFAGLTGGSTGIVAVACRSYSNSDKGFALEGGNPIGFVCIDCLAYNNTNHDFDSAYHELNVVWNCTSDGENGAGANNIGVQLSASILRLGVIGNTIIYDQNVGIKCGQDIGPMLISLNNLLNSNTTNYTNATTHSGEVTGAPDFVNEAGDDYRLNSTSPAKAAGIDAGNFT